MRREGLYCPAGDFYIDPWKPVPRAVITHAHSDHARAGSEAYLTVDRGETLLRKRMGAAARIETIPYGQGRALGTARVSLHPAGHILGSAQVRIEMDGRVTVVSGDFNSTHDAGFGDPFEVVSCDCFITESTFGLPIYRWPEPKSVFAEIRAWWEGNARRGITSILPAYPLGKTQRLVAGLGALGPIGILGNGWDYLEPYRAAGVSLPLVLRLTDKTLGEVRGKGLVICSSGAAESALLDKLGATSWGFASGWMMTRAARRHRDYDRGFVLSDHADWDGLVRAIEATGAHQIGVTHGETRSFTRWLTERGWEAFPVPTRFTPDAEEAEPEGGSK